MKLDTAKYNFILQIVHVQVDFNLRFSNFDLKDEITCHTPLSPMFHVSLTNYRISVFILELI